MVDLIKQMRSEEADIEVTPEMVREGASIVMEYDGKFVTSREIAEAAYRAMEAVRRASLTGGTKSDAVFHKSPDGPH